MNYDPYQAPSAPPPLPTAPYGSNQSLGLSQRAAYELLGSQGWARFVSVFMFIMAGIMVFGIIRTLSDSGPGTVAPGYGSGYYERAVYERKQKERTIGLVSLSITAILVTVPAILAAKVSSAIKRYRFSGSMTDVEEALRQQKVYWRFVGIMGILFLGLMALGIVSNV